MTGALEPHDKTAEDQVRRIEELVRRVDQIPDPEARATAGELMESILALHGAGMERMMELVAESGQAGDAAIRRFANDSLVASLLVLHGLHPDDLETRVRQVLAKSLCMGMPVFLTAWCGFEMPCGGVFQRQWCGVAPDRAPRCCSRCGGNHRRGGAPAERFRAARRSQFPLCGTILAKG